ncbi:MAG: tetratricopeptide repeat protein [bacterium]
MKNKKIVKYILIGLGVLTVLGLIYYFLIFLPNQSNIKEASVLINEAEEFIENGNYFSAVEKYQEASEIDGRSTDAYVGLAEIYLLKNRQDNAIDILQIGINKARNSSRVNQVLGRIYLSEGDYSKAIYFLKKSVSSDKNNDDAKFLLAQAYVGTGDLDQSESVLDVSDNDKNLYAKAKLLNAMLIGEDTKHAKGLLDDINSSDLDDEVADQVEFFNEVLDYIDSLDDDIKTDVYVSVMISRAALYSGYPDLVIGLLSEYVEEYDLYWELNLYLGHAYLLKYDYENALVYLSQAYLLESDLSISARLLARAYLGDDNVSDTIKYYEKAINLAKNQNKVDTRLEYFEVLIEKEQYVRAEEQLDLLLLVDDIDTDTLLIQWGDSLLDRELYSQLEENMEKIKINNLDDDLKAEYYYLEAGVSLGQASWDDATEAIEKAIEIDDKMAKYHLLYGRILYQSGVDIQAKVELERSVELDLEGEVSTEAQKVLDRI